jgi:hypothetical protein
MAIRYAWAFSDAFKLSVVFLLSHELTRVLVPFGPVLFALNLRLELSAFAYRTVAMAHHRQACSAPWKIPFFRQRRSRARVSAPRGGTSNRDKTQFGARNGCEVSGSACGQARRINGCHPVLSLIIPNVRYL